MNGLIALAVCMVAAGFEGICAGRDPMAQLKALRQPRWSPPNWLWVLIGLAWYGLCYAALVRLLPFWKTDPAPVLFLGLLLMANGAANLFQFRLRRLDLAFLFLPPYWVLLAAFLWRTGRLDPLTAWLFVPYSLYQLYAAVWAYALWRMNRR